MTTIELIHPLNMDGTNSQTVNLIYGGYSFMMFRDEGNIIPHAEFICEKYREEFAGYKRIKSFRPEAIDIDVMIRYTLHHLIILKTAMNLYKQKRIFVYSETFEQADARSKRATSKPITY